MKPIALKTVTPETPVGTRVLIWPATTDPLFCRLVANKPTSSHVKVEELPGQAWRRDYVYEVPPLAPELMRVLRAAVAVEEVWGVHSPRGTGPAKLKEFLEAVRDLTDEQCAMIEPEESVNDLMERI